ncbi:MAG: ThuA domain-containing protein [Phycisphaerales bacterium]|nr:ThuA domain-containing protein [Phycisphaerales bacterium]
MPFAAVCVASLAMSAVNLIPQPAAQPTARPTSQPAAQPAEPFAVLVYSRTAGFRHDNIPDGIRALQELGETNGFTVDATEDPAQFTPENLDKYGAVVFLSTTGDILNPEQEKAFEGFIAKGRGFVGIHAAADTEYDWPWYGELVGGYFKSHPAVQPADVLVVDPDHPSTRHLPEVWRRTDEWYNYRENPRGTVHVLLDLDESTYQNGGMDGDHPIAWCREFAGGRAFYTGGGHTTESFSEVEFLQHVLGGIRWAAGVADEEAPEPGALKDVIR